jgi:hypothetical protein
MHTGDLATIDAALSASPTFVLHETGELFWDTDRVWLLRERLSDKL